MESTREPDRKRRHFNSISPTATTPKTNSFFPCTDDRKLDTGVLQFQNQKLVQKLEAQKVECVILENKLLQLNERQKPYNATLEVVSKSWESLVDGFEACSIPRRDLVTYGRDHMHRISADASASASSQIEDVILSRLVQTDATESCSSSFRHDQMEDGQTTFGRSKNIWNNLVGAINSLCYLNDGIHTEVLKSVPKDGSCAHTAFIDLKKEIKNLRVVVGQLHLNHKSLAGEMQNHRDAEAKNKAKLQYLRDELKSTIVELEESNCKLETLKAERDLTKGSFSQVLNLGNKHNIGDRTQDQEKDIQILESALKELMDQASNGLLELKRLHEERIEILKMLSNLQNTLKNVKYISSSQAYISLREQLVKSKADVFKYQALFVKLQSEKDILTWREKDMHMKKDVVDVLRRSSTFFDSRIIELLTKVQKQIGERNLFEAKMEEHASRECGRKEVIAEFKALVSSFPDMATMQVQLRKYKEASVDIHTLRADMRSLSKILARKAKQLETLSTRSVEQADEIQRLQAVVQDLKESDSELKLILEMFSRESTDSSDVWQAKDSEYKAWACVQSLRSSLDEHKLELRVKMANEAEALSQQRLASAEADIADLRSKFEASKRDLSRFSDDLKAKHEENESYLSEIEIIGQAYDDMQNQNQHMLQRITERDDCNIKLFLEGVKDRQINDALLMEKVAIEKEIQHATACLEFNDVKVAKVEDQIKLCANLIQKFEEERKHNTVILENTHDKMLDVSRISQEAKESLEESQLKVDISRVSFTDMQIEMENERFDKKRIEDELEISRGKASRLKAQTDRSSVVGKLHKELEEYKKILECSICLDRPKEVVITKCYHLFCSPCIQRIVESRHRKCPVCCASFGANDVKPVYI